MKNYNFLCLMAIALIFTWSCDSSKSTSGDEKSETEVAESATEVKDAMPTTAVTVTHGVAEFSSWLEAYNAHDSMRLANGMTGGNVHRDVQDTNRVTVSIFTSDHESARAFFGKPELITAMDEAGVNTEPEITFWDITWAREGGDKMEFEKAFFVRHDVNDVAVWSEKFAAHDSIRSANGVIATVTATNADMPNHVGIYLGIQDLEKANEFLNSPDLQQVMADAGVVGEPTVRIVNVIQ